MTPSEFAQLRDLITGVAGQLTGLAVQVADLANRISSLEDRLGSLEDRLGSVETRLDSMEARQTAMEDRQTAMEDRLGRLEVSLEEMRHDFRAFGESLQVTDRRIDALQAEMNVRFEEQRAFTAAGFRDWGERVTRIEERLAA